MADSDNTPTVTQTFALPIILQIEAGGTVAVDQLKKHVGDQLAVALNQDLADRIDRNPDDPMPFAYRGAAVYWEAADDVGRPDSDSAIVAVRLSRREREFMRLAFRYKQNGFLHNEATALLRRFGLDRAPGS